MRIPHTWDRQSLYRDNAQMEIWYVTFIKNPWNLWVLLSNSWDGSMNLHLSRGKLFLQRFHMSVKFVYIIWMQKSEVFYSINDESVLPHIKPSGQWIWCWPRPLAHYYVSIWQKNQYDKLPLNSNELMSNFMWSQPWSISTSLLIVYLGINHVLLVHI